MGDRIRTPDQRLRVFVSSTLGELADERAAARDAIEQLRLAPVMFELGARPHPPRALYRAYLEQSDVFVGIYWQRYGWIAPDMDISGLEDEYRLSTGLPRLMYLKRPAPEMEPELRGLLDDLEGDGTVSYRPFTTPQELHDLLLDDLAVMLAERFDAADAPEPTQAASVVAPQPTTRLVGRHDDVAEVAALIAGDAHRLVTLTGVGGIGKTRLALAVMERTADGWPGGAFFVDLTAATQPSAVVDVIATSCGIVPEGRETQIDALSRKLSTAPALLVLDNFEHVVAAAPTLAELLQRCPPMSALVTSRTVLHLRGEQEWPVAPLDVPAESDITRPDASAAVELFVERAQEARPSFAVTPDNAADVVELCRRLDGLPLALELVAPRIRMLTPGQILDRLGERLDLAGSFADLPERQRTLGATLDWSYALLDATSRTLFARLAVFSGPFTLDAAEEVCGDELDVVDALSVLVDHSLVATAERADGKPGFRMLETVRAYASERLRDSGERDAVFERLRDYLVRVFQTEAPRLHTPEQGIALRRLDAEIGNFVAVFEWVVETGRPFGELLVSMGDTWVFWQVRGHFRRMPEMFPRIQQSPAAAAMTPRDWSAIHFAHAGNLFTSGRYGEVVEFVPTILDGIRQAFGDNDVAMMTLLIAASREYRPDSPARGEFERAVRQMRASGERIGLAYCLAHYGPLLLADGDVTAARDAHSEALAIAEDVGDVNLQAEARVQLAHDALAAGGREEARRLLPAAAELYRGIDHREGMAFCLGVRAGLAVADGDAALAARLLGAADAVRATVGITPWPLVAELERRYADAARAALTDDTYADHFDAGHALTMDEALKTVDAVASGRSSTAAE